MSKMFIFSVILLVLLGCKTIDEARLNYKACLDDVKCVELMKKNKVITSTAVDSAVDSAGVFGSIAGMLVSGLTGILMGSKFRKK